MFGKKRTEESTTATTTTSKAFDSLVNADINNNSNILDLDTNPNALEELERQTVTTVPVGKYDAKKKQWCLIRDASVEVIGTDDTYYSIDIPFKTVEQVSEAVQNEKSISGFKMSAGKVEFAVQNGYKNHIENKNSMGIFESVFRITYDSKTHDTLVKCAAEVIVPVYMDKDKLNFDSWFAASMTVDVMASFVAVESEELYTAVKDMLISVAKAVIMRSADSDIAKAIGIDLASNNIFPEALAKVTESENKCIKKYISAYTTMDMNIQNILGGCNNKKEVNLDLVCNCKHK